MKILLVGKNSSLFCKIPNIPKSWFLVGHKELLNGFSVDLYDVVILFSWAKKNIGDNEKIFQLLKFKKVIFISSVAIYSIIVRNQWNKYPLEKSIFEKKYYKNGASIIRVGFTNKYSSGIIPYSNLNQLRDDIIFCLKNPRPKIIESYKLINGIVNKSKLSKFLYKASFLTTNKFYRIPFEVLSKLIWGGRNLYGYSADTQLLFQSDFQIGYGSIGSNLYRDFHGVVIVHGGDDIILNKNGFKDTFVGRSVIGLSAYWHGVRIIKDESNNFRRKVSFVKRKKPKFPFIKCPVQKIDIKKKNIIFETNKILKPQIPFKKLYLAAGPITNAVLLSEATNNPIYLSDQLIGIAGTVDLRELIEYNFVRKIGLLVIGNKVYTPNKNEIMYDFRPSFKQKTRIIDSNFYNRKSLNIFSKLLTQFNISRINEALYLRFGFAFMTNKFNVTFQIGCKNVIKINNRHVSRSIKKLHISNYVFDGLKKFKSFKALKKIQFFDSQHTYGGDDFIDNNKTLLKEKNIFILGSPTKMKFDAFHHTYRLIHYLKKEFF